MADGQRTPPRFVPTLTVVIEEPPAPPPAPSPVAEMQMPEPPEPGIDLPPPPAPPVAQVALPPLQEAEAFQLEEQLLHRVLQRIDLSLEERLTDAVSAAVQHQLDNMVPQLRAEIEQVLRSLVVEALALELSEDPGSVPTPGPQTFG